MKRTTVLLLLLLFTALYAAPTGASDVLTYRRAVRSREIMESAPVPMLASWVTISGLSLAFKYYSFAYSQAFAGLGRRLELAPGLHLDLKTGLIVSGGLAGGGLVFRAADYVVGVKLVEDI